MQRFISALLIEYILAHTSQKSYQPLHSSTYLNNSIRVLHLRNYITMETYFTLSSTVQKSVFEDWSDWEEVFVGLEDQINKKIRLRNKINNFDYPSHFYTLIPCPFVLEVVLKEVFNL